MMSAARYRWPEAALLSLMIAAVMTACRGPAGATDTLRVGLASDLVALDRAKVSDAISWSVLANLQENLTELSPDDRQPRPALSEGWKQSPDGQDYVFTLRDGVRFHNGDLLRAADVAYSFRRFLDPKTAAPVRQWLSAVESVKVLNDREIAVHLRSPEPGFLTTLSVVPGIVPEGWGEKGPEEKPVGTGPFQFVRWERGKQLELSRFDSYWRGKAKSARVVFQVIPTENARVLALKASETDLVLSNSLSLANVEDLTQQGFRLFENPVAGLQYLAGDSSRPPFSNVHFRRALAHAIDRQGIVQRLFHGRVMPAPGPLPAVFRESAGIRQIEYSRTEAQRELAMSGVHLRADAPLELSYGTEWPWNEQLAEVLQADLQAVGIPVKPRKYEWSSFVSGLFDKRYTFFTVDLFAGNGSYSLFLGDIFETGSPLNFFRYSNRDFDQAWRAAVAGQGEDREAALHRAQQVLADDAAAVFLFGAKGGFLTAPRVRGVTMGPLQELLLREATRE
ncbi:MAG: ABC transporter substrate-binding protein [Bryobacteraceae bacterium]